MKQEQQIKNYGFLIYAIERIFAFFLWITPGTWFLSTRAKSQKELENDPNPKKTAMKRARKTDLYIVSWFVIILVCGFLSAIPCTFTKLLSSILPLYRVFDIFVVAVNITLLDRLRLRQPVKYISSIERNLILGLWNFIELFLCFSIVYAARMDLLKNSNNLFDAFYFSVITQLTIGYGDLVPIGHLKFIAMIQGMVSLVYGLLILGRFVSLLPDIRCGEK